MKKRKKNKKLKFYDKKLYKDVPINSMILFAIHSVITKNEECTFERLVKECFTFFPKVFCMSRYSQWPDTLKFDRQLRTLREKGLIVGNSKTFFSLTKFGRRIAEQTAQFLKIGIGRKKMTYKTTRGADINWIYFLKRSEAFQKFLKNKKKFSITEMELRNILRCTLETPLRVVKQNLIYSKKLAKEFKEQTLFKFLESCQKILTKKK